MDDIEIETAADRLDVPLGYASARAAGATHTEVMEFLKVSSRVDSYAAGRAIGISHKELMDAARNGKDIDRLVEKNGGRR